ncbi:MAG: flavin reductase family protein [Clostridia bacterium]|nr:flavin reductase family protein [Clostridia bacterium]
MAKIRFDGGTLLAPLPVVMVSCGTLEAPNIITIAWTGILASSPPKTYVSVTRRRYSHGLISERGEFAVNLVSEALVGNADYCGRVSGREHDKFVECGLTAQRGSAIDCPVIAESPLTLECRVADVVPLGSHDMFIADIVAVLADESVLDGNGRIDVARARLTAFAHGRYAVLGDTLGAIGRLGAPAEGAGV